MRVSPTIDWLEHAAFAGRIGLTHCPGARFGPPAAELADIQSSGASVVVTLVQTAELDAIGVPELGELIRRAGLVWHHLPIVDFGVPDEAFEHRWRMVGPDLSARLGAGESIVIHCYAGLGRTGMVAARILIDAGTPPEEAIRMVREARPGTIQNAGQMRWVLACGVADRGFQEDTDA